MLKTSEKKTICASVTAQRRVSIGQSLIGLFLIFQPLIEVSMASQWVR
jgi:hypothetical protein